MCLLSFLNDIKTKKITENTTNIQMINMMGNMAAMSISSE